MSTETIERIITDLRYYFAKTRKFVRKSIRTIRRWYKNLPLTRQAKQEVLILLVAVVIVVTVFSGIHKRRTSKNQAIAAESIEIEEAATEEQQEESEASEEQEALVIDEPDDDAIASEIYPGKLYYFPQENVPVNPNTTKRTTAVFNPKDVIKGIIVDGYSAGNFVSDGGLINGRDFSTDNIRSVFELGEWIDVSIKTGLFDGEQLEMYVMYHDMPNAFYMMHDPSEYTYIGVIDADKSYFGDYRVAQFFIDASDSNEPGYYNLVFVYENTAVAMMEFKLVEEGSLEKLSDTEIQYIMDVEAGRTNGDTVR